MGSLLLSKLEVPRFFPGRAYFKHEIIESLDLAKGSRAKVIMVDTYCQFHYVCITKQINMTKLSYQQYRIAAGIFLRSIAQPRIYILE